MHYVIHVKVEQVEEGSKERGIEIQRKVNEMVNLYMMNQDPARLIENVTDLVQIALRPNERL